MKSVKAKEFIYSSTRDKEVFTAGDYARKAVEIAEQEMIDIVMSAICKWCDKDCHYIKNLMNELNELNK